MNQHSRTTTFSMLMLTVAVLSLASCSDGGSSSATSASVTPDAPTAGSCDNAASGMCVEYTGAGYTALSMQGVCESQKLAFLAGACPIEERVGSCLVYKGKRNESHYRYYTGFPGFGIKPKGGVAAAAEEQCTSLKGEWTPS